MKRIAHISFLGGGVVKPSLTPYERETLLDHAEAASQRHGDVRLRIDQQDWMISRTTTVRAACFRCKGRTGALTYHVAGMAICIRCARHALQ